MDVLHPQHVPQLHMSVFPHKVGAVVAPGPVGHGTLFGDIGDGALHHPDGLCSFTVLSLLHIEAGQWLSLEGTNAVELLVRELAQLLRKNFLQALGFLSRGSAHRLVVFLDSLPTHIVAIVKAQGNVIPAAEQAVYNGILPAQQAGRYILTHDVLDLTAILKPLCELKRRKHIITPFGYVDFIISNHSAFFQYPFYMHDNRRL